MKPPPLFKLAALGAVLAHFGLGASGLIGELPLEMRPDEAYFVEKAAQIVASRDLNPRQFLFPGGPSIYTNAGLFVASFALSGSELPFHEHFQQHRAYYYLLARLLSLACTSALVSVVFALGHVLFKSYRPALISAWLLALSPLIIAYSAYARNDASTTLLATLAAYFIIRFWQRPNLGAFCASAIFAGLAAGNRYFMAFLIGYGMLALLAIGYMRRKPWRQPVGLALGFAGISLVAFLISNPFLLVEHEIVLQEIRTQGRTTHLGADGLSPLGNFVWYLSNTLPEGLTFPQAVLAIVGFANAVTSRVPRLVWFALLPPGYIAATSALPLHWHRWVLQALPFLSVLAGYGASQVLVRFEALRFTPFKRLGAVGLAIAFGLIGTQSVAYATWRAAPTTRQQAGAWMAANLPAGSKIYQQGYGALLPKDMFEVKGLYIRIPSVAEFVERGADYVVLSSAMYGRVMAEPARYPVAVRSTEAFMREATLIRAFKPPRECHIELMVTLCGGPTLLIYQIPHPESR